MNDKIAEYLEKLKDYWQKINNTQKIKMIVGVVATAAVLVVLFVWALTPEYTSIVSSISDSEAGEIVAELDKLGVPYKLEGTAILVPKSMAIKARYDLAASGYPKSGSIDYGIFTDTGFGMTKDQFSILKKGALEGELEKTIQNIVVVNKARVHLNIPEQSVWVKDEGGNASAAVYLSLNPGVTLDDKQILGIEQLIMMSVPGGIDRDKVILIDQNGRRLLANNAGEDSIGYYVSSQLDIKNQVESQIELSLRNSLESILGMGNVVVDAVAKMNFDQKHMLENLVTPVVGDQGIIISSQQETETSTSNYLEGGVPGVTGNDPATYEAMEGGQSGEYERTNSIINREINRIQVETKAQPYQVEDVSISVLLNQSEDRPITEDLIENITRIARNTVLTSATQNILPEDVKVNVMAYEFDTSVVDIFAKKGLSALEIIYIIGAAIGIIAIAGGAFTVLKRKDSEDIVQDLIPQAISEDLDIEINEEGQHVRKQLEKLARQKPEEFTKLLRTWLIEDN